MPKERSRERQQRALEEARRQEEAAQAWEEAAQAWAELQVRGTRDALARRRGHESLGAALWLAGAQVDGSLYQLTSTPGYHEGLLASNATAARAEESEEDEVFSEAPGYVKWGPMVNRWCDGEVGFVEDYTCIRSLRRAAHGAPRRVKTETAWVEGKKQRAKAPVRARQQKHRVVAGSRSDVANMRAVREVRRTRQPRH